MHFARHRMNLSLPALRTLVACIAEMYFDYLAEGKDKLMARQFAVTSPGQERSLPVKP